MALCHILPMFECLIKFYPQQNMLILSDHFIFSDSDKPTYCVVGLQRSGSLDCNIEINITIASSNLSRASWFTFGQIPLQKEVTLFPASLLLVKWYHYCSSCTKMTLALNNTD